jgi:tail lysozyme
MACTVTPLQVYQALTKAGFSTTQAIGVMANGIAESGLNPEADVVDSNGYRSYGIWQFNAESYPNAAGLVTGNCAADLAAQVGLVKAAASGQALSGSTGAEVAGNFAQYFERCQTCTPGGSSYQARVAEASTVAGWASSGNWPASAGSLSGSGSSSSATGATCAFGPKLPLVGQVCLVKKTTIRHAAGVSLMATGGALASLGVILLAAFAFRQTGGLRAASDVAAGVGLGAAAEGLDTAHRRMQGGQGAQVASQRRGARVAEQRRQARAQTTAERQRRQAATAAERERRRQQGTETVVVEERTPIEGEMGGTRRTRRTVRRPARES